MTSNINHTGPSENPVKLNILEMEQKDKELQIKFNVLEENDHYINSNVFIIQDLVVFQMSMTDFPEKNYYQFHVKFTKIGVGNPDHKVMYSHEYDNLSSIDTCYSTDDKWHLIQTYFYDIVDSTFKISVILCDTQPVKPVADNKPKNLELRRAAPCASLHDDTVLTDFELRGKDGSVHMHKAIAAAASPFLRTMFSGEWRETAEGVVNVEDTCVVTLQQLKDYIYLDTLPDTGLQELLPLASYYLMSDLEQRCVNGLVKSLNTQNAYNLIEFALKHDVKQLMQQILQNVQSNKIKIEEMPEFENLDNT